MCFLPIFIPSHMVSQLRSSAGPRPGSLLSCTSQGGVPNATHKVQAKCSPSFLHPRGEKQAEKHKYGIPGIVQRSVGTMGQRRVKTPNVTKQDPMKPSWDGPFPIPSCFSYLLLLLTHGVVFDSL